jgi:hypothetical protein
MDTKDTKLFMKKVKYVTEIYTNYLQNQMDSKSMKLIMKKRRYVNGIFNNFFVWKRNSNNIIIDPQYHPKHIKTFRFIIKKHLRITIKLNRGIVLLYVQIKDIKKIGLKENITIRFH